MYSGLLNRTGASLGIRAFRTEWSCLQGVCVLFGTVLWVLLSFDMMAAVAGLVFAISFGVLAVSNVQTMNLMIDGRAEVDAIAHHGHVESIVEFHPVAQLLSFDDSS